MSPTAGGTINWEPPAYSPDTGLFYVSEKNGFSMFYLTDHGSARVHGTGRHGTRERRRGRELPDRDRSDRQARSRGGVRIPGPGKAEAAAASSPLPANWCSRGDAGGNIVAYDAVTGKPLWHSHIGSVTNAPQTYMLDGRQHLLVATGDTLYAFTCINALKVHLAP